MPVKNTTYTVAGILDIVLFQDHRDESRIKPRSENVSEIEYK